MILSQYLHSDIVNVLLTFGDLDDVVNRILDASDEGYFDIANKPQCRNREGCSRYDIRITNENYLRMLKTMGVKNKSISLRRLIYWFVDNEVYNEIGWEPVRDYLDKNDKRINKVIDEILQKIDKLEVLTGHTYDDLKEIINCEWRN